MSKFATRRKLWQGVTNNLNNDCFPFSCDRALLLWVQLNGMKPASMLLVTHVCTLLPFRTNQNIRYLCYIYLKISCILQQRWVSVNILTFFYFLVKQYSKWSCHLLADTRKPCLHHKKKNVCLPMCHSRIPYFFQ